MPLRIDRFHQELLLYQRWYSEFRPHQSRNGRTPNEVAEGTPSAPLIRFEPRPRLFELHQRCRKREADVVQVNDLRVGVEQSCDEKSLDQDSLSAFLRGSVAQLERISFSLPLAR